MEGDLHYASLIDISGSILRREISAQEVCKTLLARIDRLDGKLNSFIRVLPETALAEAAQADREIASGLWRGPLHGVPIGIKDLIDVAGTPTTAGMEIRKDFYPQTDATVVTRLRRAGAVIIGKLHTTEGATVSHHPAFARPDNPWREGYWTGVSSSGSGVATAAGFCFGALGTDTGGSIRIPSAACGLSGIKPTWGRVSRQGVFPLAESFDHVGPLARSTADAAAILQAIAGADPLDPTALCGAVPDFLAGIGNTGTLHGLSVGIDWDQAQDNVDPAVVSAFRNVIAVLESLGASIRPVSLQPFGPLLGEAAPLLLTEEAAAHEATFPLHAARYGPDLRSGLELAATLPATLVAKAVQARERFKGGLRQVFEGVDLLLTPALPIPTPTWAEIDAMSNDMEAVMNKIFRFSIPFNVSGTPTLSLPCGLAPSGLPIGVQLIAPHLDETLLCRVGHAFQQATDFHTLHPKLP